MNRFYNVESPFLFVPLYQSTSYINFQSMMVCLNSVPRMCVSDVPDSALILRKHGMRSNLFSCLLFNELEAFNPRDQLAFAYVRDEMRPKVTMNMFEVEVFEHIAVEYRHNLKHSGTKLPQSSKTKRASPDLFANGTCSMCESYLLEMWGEPRN